MNWKVRLDRYLTSPPDDDYDRWSSAVMEAHDQEFYEANCPWLGESQYDRWLSKCFDEKNLEPKAAAELIERTHRFFKIPRPVTGTK